MSSGTGSLSSSTGPGSSDSDSGSDSFLFPSKKELSELSRKVFGYELPVEQEETWLKLVNGILASFPLVLDPLFLNNSNYLRLKEINESFENQSEEKESNSSLRQLTVELSDSLPARVYSFSESSLDPLNAWTVRTEIKLEATTDAEPVELLKEKVIVLKDTISVRSIPLSCGTPYKFLPDHDSPLVSRLLKHGATIVGMARCEFFCYNAGSHTSTGGAVKNPHALSAATVRSSGGSSSGCGALVGDGQISFAIGGDQGGSIRVPSAWSGCVGMKPTHGLVPYTGVCALYSPIDHVGPITDTVENNALLLSCIAGWDGVDKRATELIKTVTRNSGPIDYLKECQQPDVKGLRVAFVSEGITGASPSVVAASDALLEVFKSIGMKVTTCSIPLHLKAFHIFSSVGLSGSVEAVFHQHQSNSPYDQGKDMEGNNCERDDFFRNNLLQEASEWPVNLRTAFLAGEWVRQIESQRPDIKERGKQCVSALRFAYDEALNDADVLYMPTIPFTATPLPTPLKTNSAAASNLLLVEHMAAALPMCSNTIGFNLTHHPALTLPIGMETRVDSDSGEIRLPIGGQLVAKHLHEKILYRVAAALAKQFKWQERLFRSE